MNDRFIAGDNFHEFCRIAVSWNGTPFRHRSMVKGYGVDCVHYIAAVLVEMRYRQMIEVVEYPSDYMRHNTESLMIREFRKHLNLLEVRRTDIRGGDLLSFRIGMTESHAGFYLEDGNFIHSQFRKGVRISSLYDNIWKQSLRRCFVLLPWEGSGGIRELGSGRTAEFDRGTTIVSG